MEKDVQTQIQELEGKIKLLRSSQLTELQEKLKEARAVAADLEHQIAKTTGKAPVAASEARRTRTSSEEIRSRILKALSAAPKGLSQKEITTQTGLNYNTVVLYLKNHGKDFKSAGSLRAKRYFLK
jgi:DNA-binding NarL/FixJ family response regulator